MIKKLKLFLLKRRIAHLEAHEQEVASNLKHIRHVLLPALRDRRNQMLYPVKARYAGVGNTGGFDHGNGKRPPVANEPAAARAV
ncbi:MAG: hypothetical protein RBU21_25350 [FCB group bacterium]|jgi:hypothetical protein|nr:hypothetical protein [FCB group bacterium]